MLFADILCVLLNAFLFFLLVASVVASSVVTDQVTEFYRQHYFYLTQGNLFQPPKQFDSCVVLLGGNSNI